MTIHQAYLLALQTLSSLNDIEETKAIIKRLLEEKFQITSKELILQPEKLFVEEALLKSDLSKLLNHLPLQQLLGYEWFCDLKININQDVLIPRQETEELVKWIISENQDIESIADICTGSGCIALALKNHFKNTVFFATDVSDLALNIAQQNASQLNLYLKIIKHDILRETWTDAIPQIVVSNPPYIKKQESINMSQNVLQHEPHLALFVEDDDALLFYKKIISQFASKGSKIYFELNPLTAFELKNHCESLSLNCELKPDMQGKWRFARIQC